jgi:hypothetical protein
MIGLAVAALVLSLLEIGGVVLGVIAFARLIMLERKLKEKMPELFYPAKNTDPG